MVITLLRVDSHQHAYLLTGNSPEILLLTPNNLDLLLLEPMKVPIAPLTT